MNNVPRRGKILVSLLFGSVILALYLVAVCNMPSESQASAKGGGIALAGERTNDTRKHFVLSADGIWHVKTPGGMRFDASGLIWKEKRLLTVSDRGPELFELVLETNSNATLKPAPFFRRSALAAIAPRKQRYDCEGIAIDGNGNVYISEESERAIYRSSNDAVKIDLLPIDWSPVKRYFSADRNASFEGIAIGSGKLFVANERDEPRIIAVDLQSLKILDSFYVDSDGFAFGGPHYSDLAFAEGRLFVLDRNHRVILEVDPESKRVVAEYNFGTMEVDPDLAYKTVYPTGTMEGLAVDAEYFWLITDNNGLPRFKHPEDTRPTLFRCKRPRTR